MIVDINKRTNEGALIGSIDSKDGTLTKVKLSRELKIGDRIRINDELDYYFTVDKIYDLNKKEINKARLACLLNIYKDFKKGLNIYKMVDSSIDLTITNDMKKPIKIKCYGYLDKPLKLVSRINGKEFIGLSDSNFQESNNKPITHETLFNQLSKLNETPFYLDQIDFNISDNLFMTISSINSARRNLIDNINNYFQNAKDDFIELDNNDTYNYIDTPFVISAYCETNEQVEACKKAGIKAIYSESNYINYVNAKYDDINGLILVGNYGGLYKYRNKGNIIVSDYSFNVINSSSIYNLLNSGVNIVTLSLESSLNDIKDMYNGFVKNYKAKPNIEIVTYGHQKLMTMKYCPIKRYNECGKCSEHTYYLKDDKSKFYTLRKNCITSIYNEKALNLIDDLDEINKYTKRIRLNFSIESYDEVLSIINNYKEKLNNLNTDKKYFNNNTETRGYFKREIL